MLCTVETITAPTQRANQGSELFSTSISTTPALLPWAVKTQFKSPARLVKNFLWNITADNSAAKNGIGKVFFDTPARAVNMHTPTRTKARQPIPSDNDSRSIVTAQKRLCII